jgi:hypothetical protein
VCDPDHDAIFARAAEQDRAERIAAADDYRTMLLATGAGGLRTVDEVLAAVRGLGVTNGLVRQPGGTARPGRERGGRRGGG